MIKQKELLEKLELEFLNVGNKEQAIKQQQYMKSQIPFFGVAMPEVKKITKKVLKDYIPKDNQEYRDTALYLFENAKRREVWYAGLVYAQKFEKHIKEENIDVYEKIIRITSWWDIVDLAAQNLIGRALVGDSLYTLFSGSKGKVDLYAKKWIKDDDMWIRRTALLIQLKYRRATDFNLLKKLILQVSGEKDFFMRKAIGWALRSYSYVAPQEVITFIEKNKNKLSTLSIREGLKVVNKK